MKNFINAIPILLIVSLVFLYSCDSDTDPPPSGTYTDVMAVDLKSDLVNDASISPYEEIFDVSPYYDDGHLPFATKAGSVDGLGTMLSGLDKNRSYLVYCHGDGPSIAGAELMAANGFAKVFRLKGNYGAWDDISFVDISADVVNSKISANEFEAIFDVSPNYSSGHLPGATNAKASAGGTDLADLIDGMDKTKTYLVYCHADAPSMAGAQLMEDAGFNNVFRLEGNYGAWVDAGYDVEM
jgi:rhodanese-related sulfurtransferase